MSFRRNCARKAALLALAVVFSALADAPARAAAPAAQGATIAVLPLANTGDAKADYFADAMTDELGIALSKVPKLVVAGRVSAYKFKDGPRDLRAIGEALNSPYLLDGSAAKDGGRIKLSARLVRASDGAQLWTATYDRPFSDVFAVEEDVAKNTASALKLPLGIRAGESLIRQRTANMEAFDKYLRAKPFIRARGRQPFAEAAKLLEDAVKADPDFEPALALLAFDYTIAPLYDPALRAADTEGARKFVQSVVPRAEDLAMHAIALDPIDANGYLALAYAALDQSNQLGAEDQFKKAIQLDPGNANALHGYSQQLAAIGRIKESLAMRLQLQALEPFFINYTADTAEIYWLDNQSDVAIKMLDQFRPGRTSEMAQFTAAAGRYKEAASLLREMPASNYAPGLLETAAHLLETAPMNTTPPDALPKLGNLGWIYLHLKAPERVMEYYESNVKAGYFQPISTTWFWHPSYAEVRKLPRFKQYMRDIGMVAYWRKRGWPAACRPVDADEFACG